VHRLRLACQGSLLPRTRLNAAAVSIVTQRRQSDCNCRRHVSSISSSSGNSNRSPLSSAEKAFCQRNSVKFTAAVDKWQKSVDRSRREHRNGERQDEEEPVIDEPRPSRLRQQVQLAGQVQSGTSAAGSRSSLPGTTEK